MAEGDSLLLSEGSSLALGGNHFDFGGHISPVSFSEDEDFYFEKQQETRRLELERSSQSSPPPPPPPLSPFSMSNSGRESPPPPPPDTPVVRQSVSQGWEDEPTRLKAKDKEGVSSSYSSDSNRGWNESEQTWALDHSNFHSSSTERNYRTTNRKANESTKSTAQTGSNRDENPADDDESYAIALERLQLQKKSENESTPGADISTLLSDTETPLKSPEETVIKVQETSFEAILARELAKQASDSDHMKENDSKQPIQNSKNSKKTFLKKGSRDWFSPVPRSKPKGSAVKNHVHHEGQQQERQSDPSARNIVERQEHINTLPTTVQRPSMPHARNAHTSLPRNGNTDNTLFQRQQSETIASSEDTEEEVQMGNWEDELQYLQKESQVERTTTRRNQSAMEVAYDDSRSLSDEEEFHKPPSDFAPKEEMNVSDTTPSPLVASLVQKRSKKPQQSHQPQSVNQVNQLQLELKNKVSQLNLEIESYKQETEKLKNQNGDLARERQQVARERRKLQDDRAQMQISKSELQKDSEKRLAMERASIAKAKARLDKREREMAMAQIPTRKERGEIDSLKATLAKVKLEAEEAANKFRNERNRLIRQLKASQARVGELEDELKHIELERLDAWDAQVETAIQEKDQQVVMYRKENKKLQTRVQELQGELETLKQQAELSIKRQDTINRLKGTINTRPQSQSKFQQVQQIQKKKDPVRSFSEQFSENVQEPENHHSDSIVLRKMLRNGKEEIIYNDGSRVVKFRNGTTKKVFPNGNTVISFANGDVKETDALANVETYTYAENQTRHTTFPDGVEVFEFANQQVERRFPNGRNEIYYPDGTRKLIHENGTEVNWFTDGTKLVEMPDGSRQVLEEEDEIAQIMDIGEATVAMMSLPHVDQAEQ